MAAAISITAPTTAARRGVVVLVNVGDGLLSKPGSQLGGMHNSYAKKHTKKLFSGLETLCSVGP